MKLSRLRNTLYTRIYRKRFGFLGKDVAISRPLSLSGAENIFVEDGVYIGSDVWLFAVALTGTTCCLKIKRGCSIGRFCHICSTQSIVIGENVLIAEKVYITDNLHSYEDVKMPVISQPIKQINNVSIGEGSWIGENVCIIGAKIGRHCVIGANSVVTKDIPDYCVAVGAPARIIKKYSFNRNTWERV